MSAAAHRRPDAEAFAAAPTAIRDPLPHDDALARAVGFSVPARYNASDILFDNLSRGHRGRIAVTGPAGTWTYEALCAQASRVANALTGWGLARGERVICLLDDRPDTPAIIFGAMRAGCVPVLLNTQSPADLVAFYALDSGAETAFVEADLLATLGPEAFAAAGVRRLVAVGGAAPAAPRGLHVSTLAEAVEGSAVTSPAADTSRDDMAFWMYSSGSTGRPKGVVHLHHDMAYTAATYAAHVLRLAPDDVCFSVPKIFFAYGFGNSCTFPFSAGAAALLLPGRPDPDAVFKAIERFRPTVLFGLPTLYTALVKHARAEGADLSSLRLCLSAAEVLATEIALAWQTRFGLEIVEGLGSTEMLHIYLSNTPGAVRPGAAGRPVPGYEVRLIPPDADAQNSGVVRDDGLGPAEGVMMVRGHSSAPCYWNRPDKTAETMRDGWIWTGDRFERDADGFYHFRGRADDLIKISGQWVYPLEVELCLADRPDVAECAVLALALPDGRMTLKAFVVRAGHASGDEAEATAALQAFVKGRLLPHKYPRLVEFLSALPKTGTGKIDRQALKARPLTPAAATQVSAPPAVAGSST